MFARNVYVCLKPNSVPDFTQTLEGEVLPLLRKGQGFWGLIAFVAQGGSEAIVISLWDQSENAHAYSRRIFPEVLEVLTNLIDGTFQIQDYEVSHTTIQRMQMYRALAREVGEIVQLEIYEVSCETFRNLAAGFRPRVVAAAGLRD